MIFMIFYDLTHFVPPRLRTYTLDVVVWDWFCIKRLDVENKDRT